MAVQDEQLVALYRRQGLLDGRDRPVHLPTKCPNHAACWEGEPAQRVPSDSEKASELSAPWIGARYEEAKLALVLENLRDFGGWDLTGDPSIKKGMRYLGRCARLGFERGHKVLFAGGSYAGTRVWHQAVNYAATWLAATGVLKQWNESSVPSATLAEAMDFIALLQHVKCSPLGGRRSNPNAAMWKHCGRHVLSGELDILRPSKIIVLGRGNNSSALREHVLGPGRCLRKIEIKIGARRADLRIERHSEPFAVDVVVVPHPASMGGVSRALVDTFAQLVATEKSAPSL